MKRTQIPHPVLLPASFCLLPFLFLLPQSASANSAPVVSNVVASQRTDGSGIVDVYYTLRDDVGDRCDISLAASNDGGSNWSISPSALSGDLSNVSPDRRHITWQSKTDLPGAFGTNYRVKVIADDGVTSAPQGIVFVDLPGGTFAMGDHHDGMSTAPVHTVTLSPFKMSKYEVTNAQYAEYLNAANGNDLINVSGGIVYAASDSSNSQPYFSTSSAPAGRPDYGEYSQIDYVGGTFFVRSKSGRDMSNDPVVMVSWFGAAAYCDYYGYRLPTEAEWEYAARGGWYYRFPWGDTISHSQANYRSHSSFFYDVSLTEGFHPSWNDGVQPYTSPVGTFAPNGYGLHDMSGNVWEWCNDWRDVGYDSNSPQQDPQGPVTGSHRVIRGGSWSRGADCCRAAHRGLNVPDGRHSQLGFRPSRDDPIITSISSRYCSQSKKAYFLAGVWLNQEFTATINWNAKTHSQVKWYRNSTVIATDSVSGNSVSATFNVGADFNIGDRLYVQAIADDGTAAAKIRANFEVVAPPPGLVAGVFSFHDGKYESLEFQIALPEINKNAPPLEENNKIAEIAQVAWMSILDVAAEVDLNGHAEIDTVNASVSVEEFKLAGLSVDTNLDIILTFDYASGQWYRGGGFDLAVSGKYQAPPTYVVFMVGPVPVPTYYRFAVDGSVSANCRFTHGSADNPVFSGDIPVYAGVEGMAGAGIADWLAVEGFLNGGMNFDFQILQEPFLRDWYLSLTGGIRIYLILYKYENDFLSYRWPEENGSQAFGSQSLQGADFEPMSRDYLAGDYAQWYDSGNRAKSLDVQTKSLGGTETTLQTNIFGQSNAVLAVSGAVKCFVWLYDEPSRNSLDRTMLVYSINDGSGWSAPIAIDDDGTADAMPALAVDASGNFVCVWATASQLIPDGTNLAGFADKLDIRMAVYDSASDTWTAETVTNTSALDYNPKVACDAGGNITVLWTHNDNNDMLAETPPVTNSIMARTKTGTGWQAAQTLATVGGLVNYTDIEADSAATHVVYCLDSDSDIQTDADNELYYSNNASASWSPPARLTNDAIADVNPLLVNASTGLMLIWAADGKIVSTTDISGMTGITDVVAEAGSSGQRGFVAAVSPTDNISVIWNDPSEAGSDIYTATYDPTMLTWSDIVQMTDNRDMERSITAAYSAGDTLELAYNKVHIVHANGLDAFGQVDLCVYEYQIGADLAVTADSIAISDPNAVPGDTVTLEATIANNGDTAIGNIPVAFYCGETAIPDNQISLTQMISSALAAGVETVVSVSWTIPENDEPLNVIVVIDPDLQIEDKNRQNNSASIEMFGANITIENVVINSNDGNFYISADIVNTGFVPVPDGIEFNLTVVDDPDTIIGSQSVAALQPEQSHTITLAVYSEQIAYGFNLMKLTIDPDDVVAETAESDNTRTVLLNNTVPYDLVIDGVINMLDLNVLASQWLYSTGGLSADIAPYNGDGTVNISDLARLAENWQIDISGDN